MIAYHGTNKKNAALIKRKGFKRRTYFAHHMEDALEFGGRYIFAVNFSDEPSKWNGEPDGWQFWTRERISPSAIIGCFLIAELEKARAISGDRK